MRSVNITLKQMMAGDFHREEVYAKKREYNDNGSSQTDQFYPNNITWMKIAGTDFYMIRFENKYSEAHEKYSIRVKLEDDLDFVEDFNNKQVSFKLYRQIRSR